jgi:hypothetical protein
VTRRRLLRAAGVVVVFALGVGLGDAPPGAGTQTLVRTLKPLPLAPAARQTVTVTVSNR